MAKAPAAAPAAAAPAKGGQSLIVQLGALLVLTALAAGVGWFSGGQLTGGSTSAKHAPAAGGHGEAKPEGGHGDEPVSDTVIPLAGITTNLASPADVWLRLEAAIVLDEPQDAELPDIIHQDILAYVRTLKLHQIEGASGFLHFKADLDERAALRSGGHVKRVLIRTMLFE